MLKIHYKSVIPEKLLIAIQDCLSACLNSAEQAFGRPFVPPKVVIHPKGSVAGTAHLSQNTLKLNALLLLTHQHAFIEEVVPHELAHLLVYVLYGYVRPHGKEWQAIMEHIFQVSPKRAHNFELPNQLQSRFHYQCDCRLHFLTAIRHNRIQRQQAQYRCVYCKERLHFKTQQC